MDQTIDIATGGLCVLVESVPRIEKEVDILWREKRFLVNVAKDTWPWVPKFVDETTESPVDEEEEEKLENIKDDCGISEDEKNLEEGEFRVEDANDDEEENEQFEETEIESSEDEEEEVIGASVSTVTELVPPVIERDRESSVVAESFHNDEDINDVSTPEVNKNDRQHDYQLDENLNEVATHEKDDPNENLVEVRGTHKRDGLKDKGRNKAEQLIGSGLRPNEGSKFINENFENEDLDPNPIHDLNCFVSSSQLCSDSSKIILIRRRGVPKTPSKRPSHSLKLKDTLWVSRPSQASTPIMPSKTGVLEAGTHLIREEYGTSMHEDEVRETMYAGECLGFKMDGFKDQFHNYWDASTFEYAGVDANGRSGGLFCIWDPYILRQKTIIHDQNFVVVIGSLQGMEEDLVVVNAYAPQC
uniref:RNA-directed DNA polymerase, eukaryota n=1 Tax=Lactuca sativa TaxID=4236 RepID=A0A9R1UXE9_LACSA|nr:hypothetical protein LSAT_V11C700352540 [Lactuca sativa]